MSPVNNKVVFTGHLRLCKACKTIFRAYEQGAIVVQMLHHGSLESMAQAASSGCYICAIVFANTERDRQTAALATFPCIWETRCSIFENETEDPLRKLEVNHLTTFPNVRRKTVRHAPTKFRLLPCPGIGDIRLGRQSLGLGHDTSSPATLDLALEWLRSCRGSHAQCNLLFSERKSWQPTRLLDVGDREDYWTLRTSPIPSESVQYMTLSYRWGTRPGLKLLNDNIDAMRQGLPVSQLPRTFQDVVTIARRFSIRYIWIDALCIIQDSELDWEREAPTMRHVYGRSICNIAASAASGPDSGLFRTRDEEAVLPGAIELPLLTTGGASEKNFLLFDKGYWDRHLAGGPLHKRGWVFQECLLAPRVLYFTKNQLMWECFHETKCEGFPNGMHHHESLKDLAWFGGSERGHDGRHTCARTGEMTLQTHVLWNNLLERYTSCDLTLHKDRLPAFSGIADLFAHFTGDEYQAGLWRSKLIDQLIWRVPRPKPKPQLQQWLPSWSWASVDGQVKSANISSEREYLISIIKVKTGNASQGLPALASWGSLKLTGALSALRENKFGDNYNDSNASEIINARFYIDNLDINLEDPTHDFYILPVLSLHPWLPPRPSTTQIIGLVLARAPEKGIDSFRRVAQFSTDYPKDIKRLGFDISSRGLASPSSAQLLTEISLV
ncbi:hypothetical protein LCI18_006518 [Fusarium solani-melongenae]|uniref:Uncharacterized protein n=1 Tax=Fusarium solani subsp. cucurbitae TaxID=2747967 RepID=A0ACD3Z667_FUSSC|nr:hypothetical protein LCI18_006518 [Fusarium solani-melongenae]